MSARSDYLDSLAESRSRELRNVRPPVKPPWHLAVVGTADDWPVPALAARLDTAVNWVLGRFQPHLIGLSNSPAADWARHRGYGMILVPGYGRPVRERDGELAGWADQILVFGDANPWFGLYSIANAKGIPIHFARPPRVEPRLRVR